ncbi:hypothetical protein Nepgr_031793 [Nepenthes gracilis]|uniref:Uncharacterized protein n=1 Tax=Nepenthes gracilis TaxID=150966 RepID=A0AAD3TI11_NEPGR|nr:hypothetical protein Nepgr_031793 [Nepenthes gracilis]
MVLCLQKTPHSTRSLPPFLHNPLQRKPTSARIKANAVMPNLQLQQRFPVALHIQNKKSLTLPANPNMQHATFRWAEMII